MSFMAANLSEASSGFCQRDEHARVGEKASGATKAPETQCPHEHLAHTTETVSHVLRKEKKGLTGRTGIRLLRMCKPARMVYAPDNDTGTHPVERKPHGESP